MNPLFIKSIVVHWDKVPKDSYIRKIQSLKGLETLAFKRPVTFFVGENGSGKSTLLEAMAVSYGFNPEGGTINYDFSTFDSHSELYEAVTLVKGYRRARWGYFLRAESFYNVATKEKDYVDTLHSSKEYHERSHGEVFLEIIHENFKKNGLYFLDLKMFYYRGLANWESERGYLRDTCLTSQDSFKKTLDYFRIEYQNCQKK